MATRDVALETSVKRHGCSELMVQMTFKVIGGVVDCHLDLTVSFPVLISSDFPSQMLHCYVLTEM